MTDHSSENLASVRALAFDVFGTTVDWHAGVAREAKAMLAPKGHDLDWGAFAMRWRKEYQPAMEAVRSGGRGYVILDTLHREMLEPVLAEYRIDSLDATEKQELAYAWRKLDPWPDVLVGMARLKKKYTLIALSNGNIALISAMAKRASIPWDVVLGAELVKQYKPRGEVYDSAASLLSLENHQVMMVACHIWDLDGAKTRGLKTGYVRRVAEYGAVPAPKPPTPGTYDLQVADFSELADALEV
jgi:2-haloacid dehalogenase